jgi:hypothetical protein
MHKIALLSTTHEVSDWVITVDRNMGIEFFDHGGKPALTTSSTFAGHDSDFGIVSSLPRARCKNSK